MLIRYFLLFIFLITKIHLVLSQDVEEINIAQEYISAGQIEKAKDIFEKLSKKKENIKEIYKDYSEVLTESKDFEILSKFIKKSIKAYPENFYYKIDLYLVKKNNEGNKRVIDRELEYLLDELNEKPTFYVNAGTYLSQKNAFDEALIIFIKGRKFFNNEFLYLDEMVQIYKRQGKEKEIILESISYLEKYPTEIEQIQNILQTNLDNEEDFQILEDNLYKRIQKSPNDVQYNELLYWMYVQKKNFTRALIQAKAIDKRKNSNGSMLISLGKIALENKKYEDAIVIFKAVTYEYKGGDSYDVAVKNIIFSKEELIKKKYPVDRNEVMSLSNEYRKLVIESKGKNNSVEPLRRWAMLEALYLDNRDTAIVLLNESIKNSANDANARDLSKMDLADIFVYNDEPWEAVLLYYQIEKSQKEQPLGYEAKLRNAKLSYYKGEFELAKDHLDVLKLSTTREISNDAIYLSLMIQDNILEDSSGAILKEYSKIGLLLFQNKIIGAIDSLHIMLLKYTNTTLTDDIHFELGKAYKKIGKYEKSLEHLYKFKREYSEELLADDAILLIAKIFEEELKDTSKAQEAYLLLFTNYSSSIFADEARKKYRLLRGDKI